VYLLLSDFCRHLDKTPLMLGLDKNEQSDPDNSQAYADHKLMKMSQV
jgi:hypothetical protein